jgi:hypothetical protein
MGSILAYSTGNVSNSAIGEFDKYKDFIGRVSLKKLPVTPKLILSGGISHLNGGMRGSSAWRFTTIDSSGIVRMKGEKNPAFVEGKSPRIYTGADLQVEFPLPKGSIELRAETIFGSQSATLARTNTPGTIPLNKNGAPDSVAVRKFSGAYFYLLYKFAGKHQVFAKYDFYDPNTGVAGLNIKASSGFTQADIRFNTLGFGYIYYISPFAKIVLYAESPKNEVTGIKGFTRDVKDNNYTMRFQFRF